MRRAQHISQLSDRALRALQSSEEDSNVCGQAVHTFMALMVSSKGVLGSLPEPSRIEMLM